jgi:hypothetical protein
MGALRLLQSSLGDQAGWLLGFAVVAGLALVILTRLRRSDPTTGWLIAVGGAFATTAIVFSFAQGIFHPYYVSFLAPFTAALVGAGVAEILSGGLAARLVALFAIGAAAVTELAVLGTLSGALSWAKPLVIAVCLGCTVALAFVVAPRLRLALLGVAQAALLAAPATWAADTIGHATSGTFPAGGPAGAGFAGRGFRGGGHFGFGEHFGFGQPGGLARLGGGLAPAFGLPGGGIPGQFAPPRRGFRPPGGGFGSRGGFAGGATSLTADVAYADTHGGGTIGVESQSTAAAAILALNANIAGLGGFSGRESSVTATWIAMEVREGRLRWIVTTGGGQGIGAPGDTRTGSKAAFDVVAKTCKAVRTSGGATMYDCQGRAAAIRAAAGDT